MFFENRYRDNQPLTRIGSMPVYGTTIIVAALVVGLVFSALAGYRAALLMFAFRPELFWQHGQVWRALSYLIVDQSNFFTIFSLLFLYSFGRNCEQELGRARYFGFLALLIATPVAIATLLWLAGIGGGVAGSLHLSMGLVIAFATIYPNVEWLAGIPMKFVALGCMFLAAVGHLGDDDHIGLGSTLATCAVSFGYIRAMRAGTFEGFSLSALFRRKPKFRVLPSPDQRGSAPREDAPPSDLDTLLDKIAKSGMASLTAQERARLEAAREELLKRDRR
jgi:membrane associated rhomboid family serine protease